MHARCTLARLWAWLRQAGARAVGASNLDMRHRGISNGFEQQVRHITAMYTDAKTLALGRLMQGATLTMHGDPMQTTREPDANPLYKNCLVKHSQPQRMQALPADDHHDPQGSRRGV